MPESSISPDPVLLRESLTIKKIICFASGESWPPTDEFWLGIQADLKDACSLGELRYSTPDNNPHRAYYNIRLLELWPFLVKKDQRWKPLRDFCRRWEQARGNTLSPEQADGLPSPSSSPSNLTDKSRSDGGSKAKYNVGLQKFIDQLFAEFDGRGTRLTLSLLETWLEENAPKDDGYDPDPEIPDFDDVELYDGNVWWKDHQGHRKNATLRTLERYISRARNRASGKAA